MYKILPVLTEQRFLLHARLHLLGPFSLALTILGFDDQVAELIGGEATGITHEG